MNNKRSKQFFKENAFVTCFSRFLRSNLLTSVSKIPGQTITTVVCPGFFEADVRAVQTAKK